MGYYYRGRYYPNRISGFLYLYEGDEDDLEVEADVTFEYDAEPYEAPSRYSPGSPGYIECTGVTVNGEITLNGEALKGWEYKAAVRAFEEWANSQDAADAVEAALDHALESSASRF